MKKHFLLLLLFSLSTFAQVEKGCPLYKVKITLKNNQSHIGFITREDCSSVGVFDNEMLDKQLRTLHKGQENTIELRTEYNVLKLPNLDLVFYEAFNEVKIFKVDIESVTILDITQYFETEGGFSDYKGSKRMVKIMKKQPFVSVATVNFSTDECESFTNYIFVSYHPNMSSENIKTFVENNRNVFMPYCDDTVNKIAIRKLLEPLNIAYFTEYTGN
jgi:cold shock CspA family protein